MKDKERMRNRLEEIRRQPNTMWDPGLIQEQPKQQQQQQKPREIQIRSVVQ